jgi:hypothetical protein
MYFVNSLISLTFNCFYFPINPGLSNAPATNQSKPLLYKGFFVECEKVRKIKIMEKPKFRNLYINFGCKRDYSKTEYHQRKDLSKRWFVYYEFLLSTGLYKSFKAYGGINRYLQGGLISGLTFLLRFPVCCSLRG